MTGRDNAYVRGTLNQPQFEMAFTDCIGDNIVVRLETERSASYSCLDISYHRDTHPDGTEDWRNPTLVALGRDGVWVEVDLTDQVVYRKLSERYRPLVELISGLNRDAAG